MEGDDRGGNRGRVVGMNDGCNDGRDRSATRVDIISYPGVGPFF